MTTKTKVRKDYERWLSSLEGQAVKNMIVRRQLGLCIHCRGIMNKVELDHQVPLSQGGSNKVSNLYASCPPCNRKKGGTAPKLVSWWIELRLKVEATDRDS